MRIRVTWRAAWCAAACAAAGACGDNRDGATGAAWGPSCAAVCEGVAKCEPDQEQDCLEECPQMREMFQQGPWMQYADCVQSDECSDVGECMDRVIAAAPDDNADEFIDGVCDFAARCAGGAGGTAREECESALRGEDDPGDEPAFGFLNVLKPSLVSCVTDCITGLDCSETDYEKVSADCAGQCGLSFPESSSSISEEPSGTGYAGEQSDAASDS